MRSGLIALFASAMLGSLSLGGTSAVGATVTWQVAGTFVDGATFAGFMKVDSVNPALVTDWSIATTTGSVIPSFVYTPSSSSFSWNAGISQYNFFDTTLPTVTQWLAFTFVNALLPANSPDQINIVGGFSYEARQVRMADFRNISVGSATAIPIPAALPLFAGGLGLLGWIARRRRRQIDYT